MTSKSKVYFFFKKKTLLSHRTKLKTFIEDIFREEGKRLRYINYIFCSDKELLSINKQYLKRDYYTDIITFELSEKEMPIEGEAYISVDRVKDNALLLNETVRKELHRVIFHGALHLCGFKDTNKKETKKMREKETKYLNEFLDKVP